MEKDTKKTYTFKPLSTKMNEIYRLSELCRGHEDDDLHAMLGIVPEDNSLDYLKKISAKQKELSETESQIYLAESDNCIVGLVETVPVRDTQNAEHAVHVWTPADGNRQEISRAFIEKMSSKVSSMKDILTPKRYFDPMQNGKLLAPMQIKFENRAEAGHSFLGYLKKNMPLHIQTTTSGFSLHRMYPTVGNAKKVFQLFENNRPAADNYLIGYSQMCNIPENTFSFLRNHAQNQNGRMSIFYEMTFNQEPVGLIWADCRGTEAYLNLFVDQKNANGGYASEAIRLLEKEFFKRGISEVKLECRQDNYPIKQAIYHNKYNFIPEEDETMDFYFYEKTSTQYASGQHAKGSFIKQTPRNKPNDKSR